MFKTPVALEHFWTLSLSHLSIRGNKLDATSPFFLVSLRITFDLKRTLFLEKALTLNTYDTVIKLYIFLFILFKTKGNFPLTV